jgi:hypothetical protein
MKKIIFLITVIAIVFTHISCKNTFESEDDKNNVESKENTEQIQKDSHKESNIEDFKDGDITSDEVEEQKNVDSFIGSFNMLVPATDGTWFLFYDNEGNEYKFYDNGDCPLARDLFFSVYPMDKDHQYQSTEFYVEYQTKEVEFYNKADGGSEMREVEVIINIEER